MRDISKKILFSIFLGVSLFFLNCVDVSAITISSSQFRFNYINNNSTSSSSYVNTGTTQSFNVTYNESLTFNAIYYKINTPGGTNGFRANTAYNIKFQIQQSYTDQSNAIHYNLIFNNSVNFIFPNGTGTCSFGISGAYTNLNCNWTPSSDVTNATINIYPRNGAFYTRTKIVSVFSSAPTIVATNTDNQIANDVGSIANTLSGIGSIANNIQTSTGGIMTLVNTVNNNLVTISQQYNVTIPSNQSPSDFGNPYSSSSIGGATNGLIGDPNDVSSWTYDDYYFSTPLSFIWNTCFNFLSYYGLLEMLVTFSIFLGFACLVVGRF